MIPMNRHLERRRMGLSAVLLGLVAGLVVVPVAQSRPDTQAASLSTAPNMGTPEGTAALVKAASALGLGAGEFHLGMPADEAIATLKSQGYLANPAPEVGVFSFGISQVPEQAFVGGAAGFLGNTAGSITTTVNLNFTMYPNPPVVSAIERRMVYPESKAPTMATTLAALRKKYGPESKTTHETLFWFYDHQGHRLSKAAIDHLQRSCPQISASSAIEPIGDRGHTADRITQGFPGISGINLICLNAVYVTASMSGKSIATGQRSSAARGWNKISEDLMTQLIVDIYDMPLEYSASTVSRNLIEHNDAAKKQKESDAAKRRPVDVGEEDAAK